MCPEHVFFQHVFFQKFFFSTSPDFLRLWLIRSVSARRFRFFFNQLANCNRSKVTGKILSGKLGFWGENRDFSKISPKSLLPLSILPVTFERLELATWLKKTGTVSSRRFEWAINEGNRGRSPKKRFFAEKKRVKKNNVFWHVFFFARISLGFHLAQFYWVPQFVVILQGRAVTAKFHNMIDD